MHVSVAYASETGAAEALGETERARAREQLCSCTPPTQAVPVRARQDRGAVGAPMVVRLPFGRGWHSPSTITKDMIQYFGRGFPVMHRRFD